eukprot:Blabericola_migrator_1__3624@NODE_2082_length_3300_cov_15_044850_g1320_i0_p1_GENE_NODE_2082_length_3300_cov_15_044850_g1320_i0NODE_2082_length_3300_cov_15_044850_g1320_i0_p1_ORF_typecomplete_len1020_score98_92_NODE_2082_length_3300_cov_15_044850_g1320_i01593218
MKFHLSLLAVNTTWMNTVWRSPDIFLPLIGTVFDPSLPPICAAPLHPITAESPLTHLALMNGSQPLLVYCPTPILNPMTYASVRLLNPDECQKMARRVGSYPCQADGTCYHMQNPPFAVHTISLLTDLSPPLWLASSWQEDLRCVQEQARPLLSPFTELQTSVVDHLPIWDLNQTTYRSWVSSPHGGHSDQFLIAELARYPLHTNQMTFPDVLHTDEMCFRVKVKQVKSVFTSHGRLPFSEMREGCPDATSLQPAKTTRRLEQVFQASATSGHQIGVSLKLPKVILEPSLEVTWTLSACDFFAESFTSTPTTITLPLNVWESCRQIVLTTSSPNLATDRFSLILPEPTGCDLYGCSGCKSHAPAYCGPYINKWVYGSVVSLIVVIAVVSACICMPWLYSSWKVGSGVFWVLAKLLIILFYALMILPKALMYLFSKCGKKKEQGTEAFHDQLDDIHLRRQSKLAQLAIQRRNNASRNARRLTLLPMLLGCVSAEISASSTCSSLSSFVVPNTVCVTDPAGVKSCSQGVVGRVSLSGPNEVACLQALSETGVILSELQLSYHSFSCRAPLDFQFWSAPYKLTCQCARCCPFTSGCKGSAKCTFGGGPNGLPDDWSDFYSSPTHPDMKVSCKQFSGCAWNGCGACNNQCSWCVVRPTLDGQEFEVALLGQLTCQARVNIQSHNISPEVSSSGQLVVGAETKMDPWILKGLGTYEMGDVWAGPKVALMYPDRTLLTFSTPTVGATLGQLGDLRCGTQAEAQEYDLLSCRADVTYSEASWSAKAGMDISFRTSWGHSPDPYVVSMPYSYGTSVASISQLGYVDITPALVPAVEISIVSAQNVQITISVGDVCPEAAFDSIQGFSGAQGAVAIITARGTCQAGFVSVISLDPHVDVTPPNLYLQTSSGRYALKIITTLTSLSFNIQLSSLDTSSVILVEGELTPDSPVLPQQNQTLSRHPIEEASSVGLPTWGKWVLGLGIPSLVVILAFCCLGTALCTVPCSWCSSCRRRSKARATIEIDQKTK